VAQTLVCARLPRREPPAGSRFAPAKL
jgi:hypothetical protein